MAATGARSELSPRERKCSLEEEEHDIDDDGPYRSDDSDFETDRDPQPGRRIWNRYIRELNESEGFDITVFPGCSFNANIVPMMAYMKIPVRKERFIHLCNMAIQKYNSEKGNNYVFVDIVSVNGSAAAGFWYYFTFRGKDKIEGLKIFRALVWDGVGGDDIEVNFCRLKENQGDAGPSHPSGDAEAVQ